mgnify:CR=1 FL=1
MLSIAADKIIEINLNDNYKKHSVLSLYDGILASNSRHLLSHCSIYHHLRYECLRSTKIFKYSSTALAFLCDIYSKRNKQDKTTTNNGVEEREEIDMPDRRKTKKRKDEIKIDMGDVLILLIFLFILYLFVKSQGWINF